MKKLLVTVFLVAVSIMGYAKPDFEIPEAKAYENAEDCKKDNEVALRSAKFYLDAKLPDDVLYSQQAAQFLLVWTVASPDISLTISDKTCPFFKTKNTGIGSQMLVAYFSGCIIYCLENHQKEHDFNMHYFALTKLLEYYEKNRSISGSDKEMDKLLKESKKSNFKEKEQKKFK